MTAGKCVPNLWSHDNVFLGCVFKCVCASVCVCARLCVCVRMPVWDSRITGTGTAISPTVNRENECALCSAASVSQSVSTCLYTCVCVCARVRARVLVCVRVGDSGWQKFGKEDGMRVVVEGEAEWKKHPLWALPRPSCTAPALLCVFINVSLLLVHSERRFPSQVHVCQRLPSCLSSLNLLHRCLLHYCCCCFFVCFFVFITSF